jgi:hypothetical protein
MLLGRAASSVAVPRTAFAYSCSCINKASSGYLYMSNERAPRVSGDCMQSSQSTDDVVSFDEVAPVGLGMLVSAMLPPRQFSL